MRMRNIEKAVRQKNDLTRQLNDCLCRSTSKMNYKQTENLRKKVNKLQSKIDKLEIYIITFSAIEKLSII